MEDFNVITGSNEANGYGFDQDRQTFTQPNYQNYRVRSGVDKRPTNNLNNQSFDSSEPQFGHL